MSSRKLIRESYTVGWMTVLDPELEAARALLDEEHESLEPEVNDDSLYILGRMGKHNVVIACSHTRGTHYASRTITNMQRSFPKIQFGLMVGVGAGVPKIPSHPKDPRKDIRLGDVVVSEPQGNDGGVFQYDMGKHWDNRDFQVLSHMNKPPAVLLKAVKVLRSDHRFRKSKMQEYIYEAAERLKSDESEDVKYPGASRDLLFSSEYRHVSGDGCNDCDMEQTVHRIPRRSSDPVIHYGLIASGNAVIRSAEFRNKLRDSQGVLCFDMEAAGLMNAFPCIVIRGISNYADSHKDDEWQSYAALVAAAYAKDLLRVVPPADVNHTEDALRTLGLLDGHRPWPFSQAEYSGLLRIRSDERRHDESDITRETTINGAPMARSYQL
ncbi:purine and uridine phosphorylase [Aspergillus ellipticus CBS 707.79]|uniref:Purine and uridine phosphorylase n=1 Tax=Aspergillus ellipticus CBS 707.79 TaxID=1448320 RepID=A0A319D3C5_9EURO|nr:purine and uridine phosphorylase [Aspergillus ellipticus CBS 707.79]